MKCFISTSLRQQCSSTAGIIATSFNKRDAEKMATEKERDAAEYLKRHRIMELLENLSSLLFFYRPEKPTQFLVEQLEQLKMSQESGGQGPNLFNNSNLDAVLGILDPTNIEHITFAQYKHALTTLGIKDFDECPEGANEDRISYETFKTEAMQGLQRSSATYEQL
ncbi:EF-hand calcium-binding domain-containing protein 10 [Hippoglossus stenolepis]|uniref:EF-hand calcium-binding domain-containing protein 10 n=1 Tax=Hippoglossus stenolepis TaxID=195615 RepID=UPI00159CB8B7|nr:EF-hand calcium-binding domain-containing protein 10 [Hippoglossus stenolepis]